MTPQTEDRELRAFRVTGRVQGVGFRWWTRKTADRLDLTGSVRNCADGTVEVKAAGSPDALDEMARALESGPASARVRDVEATDPDPNTNRKSFEIVR
jgi:acylphosphatase